ncbi:hypothetical protein Zmor_008666 [Zophobas morio]|uniref:proline--tRNA ligase n=1 Tax=Zophobas morio TaxID=2755281 RepID=A0AA38HIV9_9CUCU|nr:hypothetical protein Zmor_008666 [Zophobas morio]
MSHSDDFGLVLPSKVSPVQIQIIKIKDSDEVNAVIEKIKSDFSNYKVFIDESDKSFGFKISEAEIKGVPIRIEVGPRDLENNSVTVSRRDLRSKESIKLDDLKNYVEEQMKSYDENIFNIAKENRDDKTFAANTIDEYQKIISEKNGIVLVPFCGEISCEADVKTKTSTNSRCIKEKGVKGKCFNCQKDSDMMVYFGRAY